MSESDQAMKEPFVMVPVALPGDPRLRKTPLAVAVYCEIFRYERKRKAPWVGRKKIAERLGCSLDTVDRAVHALVDAGWMHIERNPGKTHFWHRGRACR